MNLNITRHTHIYHSLEIQDAYELGHIIVLKLDSFFFNDTKLELTRKKTFNTDLSTSTRERGEKVWVHPDSG